MERRSTLRLLSILFSGALVLGAVVPVCATPFDIGPRTYDTTAFADSATAGFEQAVGWNLDSIAYDGGNGTYATVDIGFSDNFVFNGAGADLSIIEAGSFETLSVTIGGVTVTYSTPTLTDVMRNADNNEINILDVDLASFGVPTDGTITSLSLRLTDWGEWGSADISAVAGINSAPVPEPVSMLLLGVGTLGLGVARFRKKRP